MSTKPRINGMVMPRSLSPVPTVYLKTLPTTMPDWSVLVHNGRGVAWLQPLADNLEDCDCGQIAELGPHYRVARPS